MRRSRLALALLVACFGPSAQAQSQSPAPTPPPLRRWFEFQQFVLSTRYRLIKNSAGETTSNHMQYREQMRARVNLDAAKRYTITTGIYTGNQFTGSWNNLGPGTGDFDGHDFAMRQLFVSLAPVRAFEVQAGGLYLAKGESTEYTSYDDDGYLVGGRVSLRSPQTLYLDELSVTGGAVASYSTPNLWDRWSDLDDPNYVQVLAAKRFTPVVASSLDFTRHDSANTLRGAVSFRFKPGSAITGLRYEQYVRMSGDDPAAGFSVAAERPISKWVRLQGGYATVDEHYGGLNADRIQRGRRFFANASVPVWGPLTASFFVTQALDASYSISNRTRFDAILAWDVADSLRRSGVF
jgi:hypothetical protein